MVNIKTYSYAIGLIILILLTFFGCGGDGSDSTDSNAGAGSIGFGLTWESPDNPHIYMPTTFRAPTIDVCSNYGITTINAYIINSSNSTVTSGSWACSAHGGSHTAVPAGSNYTLRVEAVVSGAVKWRGEVTGISIITGQTTNLGQITMSYIGNDTIPPTVSSTGPASNATSIPVNSTVTATFNEKIAPSSLDTTTFTISNGPNQINGTVSYDQTSMIATFTPISPLAYSTTYSATLTTGVKDMAGNNLQSAYTWTFTTGTATNTTNIVGKWVGTNNLGDAGWAVFSADNTFYTNDRGAGAGTMSGSYSVNGDKVTASGTSTVGTTFTFSATVTGTTMTGTCIETYSGVSYTWTFTLDKQSASGSALPAPTGVSATVGDGQAAISWSSVSGATSYNIYWSTTSGVSKTNGTMISDVTSPYTHTGRTNGTTYYYVVAAVNSYGESAESSVVSVTPQAAAITPAFFLDDQFNGTALDTLLWTPAGSSVTVLNGIVDLSADVTDNTGKITTTFAPKQHIRIEMRHWMHAANGYFFPRIHLHATNPDGFVGVRWLRSAYSPDYCDNPANYNRVQIFSGTGGNCTAAYSNLVSSDYYDRWITSITDYDSVTGLFTLDNDGDGTIDFSTTVAAANRYPITSAYIDGYGWWTGHSHQIDYIKMSGN